MTNQNDGLVVVSGASSASGKTALAAALIARWPGLTPAAVKVTVTHDLLKGCPRGGSGCGVCSSLAGGYRIITDPAILAEAGTDTARYLASGADRVRWVICRPSHISDAWDALKPFLPQGGVTVVESNSLAMVRSPALSFFTINPKIPRVRWKSSSGALILRSDFLIISRHACEDERARMLYDELSILREDGRTFLLPDVEAALTLPEVLNRLRGDPTGNGILQRESTDESVIA
ncbi:MAG: hypothetical protein HY650_14685 [Acidobacteria bacterium]|nr:hypothetical protein [Acidobacteriota bacterium]